ncbi:hypothetical protein AB0D60_35145 [Streptomyces sp. NPDC048306]
MQSGSGGMARAGLPGAAPAVGEHGEQLGGIGLLLRAQAPDAEPRRAISR